MQPVDIETDQLIEKISEWSLEATVSSIGLDLSKLTLDAGVVIADTSVETTANDTCPECHQKLDPAQVNIAWFHGVQCRHCKQSDQGRAWIEANKNKLRHYLVWICEFPTDPSIAVLQFLTRIDAYRYGKWVEERDPGLEMKVSQIIPLLSRKNPRWRGFLDRHNTESAISCFLRDRLGAGIFNDAGLMPARLWTQYLMDCKEAYKREWTDKDWDHFWWLAPCKQLRSKLYQDLSLALLLSEKRRRRIQWFKNLDGRWKMFSTNVEDDVTAVLWPIVRDFVYGNSNFKPPDIGDVPDFFRKGVFTRKYEAGRIVVRHGAFHWVPQLHAEAPDQFRIRSGKLDTVMAVAYKTNDSSATTPQEFKHIAKTCKLVEYVQQPWEDVAKFMKRVKAAPGRIVNDGARITELRNQRRMKQKKGGSISTALSLLCRGRPEDPSPNTPRSIGEKLELKDEARLK